MYTGCISTGCIRYECSSLIDPFSLNALSMLNWSTKLKINFTHSQILQGYNRGNVKNHKPPKVARKNYKTNSKNHNSMLISLHTSSNPQSGLQGCGEGGDEYEGEETLSSKSGDIQMELNAITFQRA